MVHLQRFTQTMELLDCIFKTVDNYTTKLWAHRDIIIPTNAVGPLLMEAMWILPHRCIYYSIELISGDNNNEVDDDSRLTHIHLQYLLQHFRVYFTQLITCSLQLLPSESRCRMNTMLHTKQSPSVFTSPQFSRTMMCGVSRIFSRSVTNPSQKNTSMNL